MAASDTRRWIIAAIVVIAILALIAYARREPPFDDRVPDAEDAVTIVV